MQITPYTKWKPAKVKAIRTYKKNRAKKDQIEATRDVKEEWDHFVFYKKWS